MFEHLEILNPKRTTGVPCGQASWYPYYPGFSYTFAQKLIASTQLKTNGCIIDPWNGSGTTTAAASVLGYNTKGFDLNPVMVITAKARILSRRERSRLWSIAAEMIDKAKCNEFHDLIDGSDPLIEWFIPQSSSCLRGIENSIQLLLVDTKYQRLPDQNYIDNLSNIAAFFYLALFRTVRKTLKRFFPTNPTWIKKPKDNSVRLRPDLRTLLSMFETEIHAMINAIHDNTIDCRTHNGEVYIKVASSDSLPLEDKSVDLVLTSPPYCTRIDYAVATMSELAILGYSSDGSFRKLRGQLIGTSTLSDASPLPLPDWGPTCNKFLNQLEQHKSKASKSYYYKNHVQYFDAIFRSVGEMHRSLANKGLGVIVIQDSFYKEVHNDLPRVFIEMASAYGLDLGRREDFCILRTMARINPRVRKYRQEVGATESVLCFIKN